MVLYTIKKLLPMKDISKNLENKVHRKNTQQLR